MKFDADYRARGAATERLDHQIEQQHSGHYRVAGKVPGVTWVVQWSYQIET
jgi:hypothetical protein